MLHSAAMCLYHHNRAYIVDGYTPYQQLCDIYLVCYVSCLNRMPHCFYYIVLVSPEVGLRVEYDRVL